MSSTASNHPVEPLRIGRQWWIAPPGTALPDPTLMPLFVMPGKAFGSGDHPTTQLCLQSIERLIQPGMTLIDLGAGTGILSLAAARLGASPVLALDIDGPSVEEARANVGLNGLEAVIDARVGSLHDAFAWPRPPDQPTSVVANILGHVLESFLAQGLATLVSPEGWLILSGILRRQTPMLYAALDVAGLLLRAQEQQEDWVCLVAQRA